MKFEIKRLDIYRKVPQDLTEPTTSGAIISLVCVLVIISLLVVELKHFMALEIVSELFVESGDSGHDRILVLLNISLLRLDCEVTGLDIQDSNGRHEVGFIENTLKLPINNGAGCRLETQFYINKVPGNFHVSTHSAKRQPSAVDMAHVIHCLKFGDDLPEMQTLGGFQTLNEKDNSASSNLESHEYHLKIVPSIFEYTKTEQKYSYQYTYAYKMYTPVSFGNHIAAIWFRYDLTPITIKYKEREKHLYSFCTYIFAVIGGVFTISGIVSSIIFTATNIFRKIELGKLS